MNKTYNIPLVNLERLNDRVASLNKATKKLSLPTIELKVLGVTYKKISKRETMPVYSIELTGLSPKFSGWTFLGAIEFTEAGNLIKNYSPDSLEHFRTAESSCDHCQSKRSRKQTYIVKHEDGRIFRVGKNCLRDFLGHTDPHSIAQLLEHILEMSGLEGYDENRERGHHFIDLNSFLKTVVYITEKDGYVSKKNAGMKVPTSEMALMYGFMSENTDKAIKEYFEGMQTFTTDVVDKALTWLAEQDTQDSFVNNMKTVAQLPYVDVKHAGIAAYIVPAYLKFVGEEIYKKVDKVQSNFIGTIKERIIIKLSCIKDISFDSQFGTTHIFVFLDENGNKLEWMTGNNIFNVGDVHMIKATVKEHKLYKGENITSLARLKIVDITNCL
jgi:hypothetical protein